MAETKTCGHCGSLIRSGEECGCPGAVREAQKQAEIQERMADAVHIRLEKLPGSDEFSRDIRASGTDALIRGLAMLMLLSAGVIGASVEAVYARVAAMLFAPEDQEAAHGGE